MTRSKFTDETLRQVCDHLIVALTEARFEAEAAAARKRITFTLMAAFDGERRLPRELRSTGGAPMVAAFSPLAEGLEVALMALGAPTIQSLRNRPAQIVSTDGGVNYWFRFDALGQANLRLSAQSRESLASDFEIFYSDASE